MTNTGRCREDTPEAILKWRALHVDLLFSHPRGELKWLLRVCRPASITGGLSGDPAFNLIMAGQGLEPL